MTSHARNRREKEAMLATYGMNWAGRIAGKNVLVPIYIGGRPGGIRGRLSDEVAADPSD